MWSTEVVVVEGCDWRSGERVGRLRHWVEGWWSEERRTW
jgi:hypothetical protein